MKQAIDQWTAFLYPPGNQRTWFAFGGCLFWLVIGFIWISWQSFKVVLWLLGCLAIVIFTGTASLYHKHHPVKLGPVREPKPKSPNRLESFGPLATKPKNGGKK